MNNFLEKDWNFLNCGSPADLWADYRPEGTVRIKEYQKYRDGHILVSSFFVDPDDAEIEVCVKTAEGGVAVGLYYGDGRFGDFIQLVLENSRIFVQRPRGIPMGDTFRSEGADRMEELQSTEWRAVFPVRLRFEKKGSLIKGYVDDELCVQCLVPEEKKREHKIWPRVCVQSVNSGGGVCQEAELAGWEIRGIREFPVVCTKLEDAQKIPLTGYCIHLCAFPDKWTRTDDKGVFVLENIPPGSYDAVAGKAGEEYYRMVIRSTGNEIVLEKIQKEKAPDRQIVREITSKARRMNLNGLWDFEWDRGERGIREKWFSPGRHRFSKVIRVPFSFHSLEAFGEGFLADDDTLKQAASWYVNFQETGDTVWYQRRIMIPENGIWEIVFGGVSGFAKVWINGHCVGCTVDSYEEFRFLVGKLTKEEIVDVTVMVKYPADYSGMCRGKQDFWFHASPGIWQDVFLEKVTECRAADILISSGVDKGTVKIQGEVFWELEGSERRTVEFRKETDGIYCALPEKQEGLFRIIAEYKAEKTEHICISAGRVKLCETEWDATGYEGFYDRKKLYVYLTETESISFTGQTEDFSLYNIEIEKVCLPESTRVRIGEAHRKCNIELCTDGTLRSGFEFCDLNLKRWSPDSPNLFEICAEVMTTTGVDSFVRKAGIRSVDTGQYFRLNDNDIYIRGILDQGYNPWGLYTYLSRNGGKGSMEYDIQKAKLYGYNLIRMHVKDNEAGWYQLCDETGMLVWNEHPSDFYGVWHDRKWRSMYYRRLKDMIRKQNYHPSIVISSVFNESWGIMGGHELSAWEIREAQEWQKKMAVYARKRDPSVLIVDNSGYAKTEETAFLDYHIYPDEFGDARMMFCGLERENYQGNCFNCYNEKNRELMQNEERRELLQRNCSMELKQLDYCGCELQQGQPVIISEFVHSSRLEQMVRIFSGSAGYVRMNLASQENEDTSPLSATRIERDFGYRHKDFSPAGYSYINSQNLVWPEIPFLTKREAGEKIEIPVWVRIWDDNSREMTLCVWESCTTWDGTEHRAVRKGEWTLKNSSKTPVSVPIEYTVPDGVRSVQLFFTVLDNENILCENDVRFEVFDKKDKDPEWNLSEPEFVRTKGEHGPLCEAGERSGYFLSGEGSVGWKIPCSLGEEDSKGRHLLRMELSTCECVGGTKFTDEKQYGGCIEIELGGGNTRSIFLPDSPWDEKAVFSNSACSEEQEVPCKKQGKYGYGYQTDILLTQQETEFVERNGFLRIRVHSEETGVVLYGRRMGRYGTEPIIIEEGERENDIREKSAESQTGFL